MLVPITRATYKAPATRNAYSAFNILLTFLAISVTHLVQVLASNTTFHCFTHCVPPLPGILLTALTIPLRNRSATTVPMRQSILPQPTQSANQSAKKPHIENFMYCIIIPPRPNTVSFVSPCTGHCSSAVFLLFPKDFGALSLLSFGFLFKQFVRAVL